MKIFFIEIEKTFPSKHIILIVNYDINFDN